MALTRSRNLVDVVNLKLALSTYQDDEDLNAAKNEATPFFSSLDSVPLWLNRFFLWQTNQNIKDKW